MSVTCEISNIIFIGPGIVGLDYKQGRDTFKRQLWARCKARKAAMCILTGLPVKVGDSVYRTVRSQQNRMKRILETELVREAKNQQERTHA